MAHMKTHDINEYKLIHSTIHYDAELIRMLARIVDLYNNNRMTTEKFHLYCASVMQEYTIRYPLKLCKVEKVIENDT